MIALRVASFVVVALVAVEIYRYVSRRSPWLGAMFAAAFVLRVAVGLALFWTSMLELPVLRSLQLGGGFWQLAPDARDYFVTARQAVEFGSHTLPADTPSPFFATTLTLSFQLFGISPASALLLNVLVFSVTFWLLVWLCESRDAPKSCVVPLTALSFSPALVFWSTQVLKDALFVFVTIVCVVAVLQWLRSVRAGSRAGVVLWLVPLVWGAWAVGGIRPYYAVILTFAVIVTQVAAIRSLRSTFGWTGAFVVIVFTAALMWTAFKWGAGAYYPYYENTVRTMIGAPVMESGDATAAARLQGARSGFARAGGATNILGREGGPSIFRATPDGDAARRWVEPALVGLGVMFLPISFLKSIGLVDFRGGRGMLALTDVDTVFVEITLLWAAVVLWRRRGDIRDLAPVFLLVLGLVTAVLMAYVVTNYGTIFRLRMIAVLPLWLLPVVTDGVRVRTVDFTRSAVPQGVSTSRPG